LSDFELLAIVINNAPKTERRGAGKRTSFLGKNSLIELGKLAIGKLLKIKAISEAKAVALSLFSGNEQVEAGSCFIRKANSENW
jgi:hypothetical protein